MSSMKPAQKTKAYGLKGLKHLSSLTGENRTTLANWSNNKPVLFETILKGCVYDDLVQQVKKAQSGIVITPVQNINS